MQIRHEQVEGEGIRKKGPGEERAEREGEIERLDISDVKPVDAGRF